MPSRPAIRRQGGHHIDFVAPRGHVIGEHVAIRRRGADGWEDVSSRAFADEVSDLAKGVIASGIEAGDRVAVMSKTRYEWTLADMALMTAAVIVVPIYETSSAEQVEWILADSGAKAILSEVVDIRKDGDAAVVFELKSGNADFPFLTAEYQFVIMPANVSAGVSVRSTLCTLGTTRVWPRVKGRMSRKAR